MKSCSSIADNTEFQASGLKICFIREHGSPSRDSLQVILKKVHSANICLKLSVPELHKGQGMIFTCVHSMELEAILRK